MTDGLRRPRTEREFQRMNAHIYAEANKRYSDLELILRLIEEICVVEEVARKDKRNTDDMECQLARVYSWWHAVANRFNIDLQDALWRKYPNVCPWCLKRGGCVCGPEHPKILDREFQLRRLRREIDGMPELLDDHQALHMTLYGWQNNIRLPIQIAAHIAEEAGEVSKEVRHNNPEGIADELADVGSWMFAIANRYGFKMSDAVWNRYPYECERCHKSVCAGDCSELPETQPGTIPTA